MSPPESLRPDIPRGTPIRVDHHNWNQSTSAQLREAQVALAAAEKRLLERTAEVVELTRELADERAARALCPACSAAALNLEDPS